MSDENRDVTATVSETELYATGDDGFYVADTIEGITGFSIEELMASESEIDSLLASRTPIDMQEAETLTEDRHMALLMAYDGPMN